MSFDAGDIRARATLDTSPFQRSVQQLRAEGRRLANEKFTATLGADTRKGDAEVIDFERRVKAATRPASAPLTVDNAKAKVALDDFTKRLDVVRSRITTAKVDANTQSAKDRLDDLELTLRRIGRITSRPRVTVDGVETAKLQLDRLELQLARLNRRSYGGGSGGGVLGALSNIGGHAPGALPLAIGAGLPLIAPVAGLAAGAASSLITPTVAGGVGGALFAKTAASTYKQVGTDLKNLLALQKRYNAATSDKTRATALAAEKKAWSDLSPAEQKAVTTLHTLQSDWAKFQTKLHPQTFKLLSTGADIASKGLKLLTPDVKAAGNAIDTLAGHADKALSDPFWKQFFGTFLPSETHRSLTVLGTDLGNVGTGLAHLTEKFAPLGHDLERASVRWTSQFNKWTQGDGPGKFVNWVQKNGPTAATDLKDLGKGIGGILKSLAPLGSLELKAFGPILNFLGTMAEQHPKEVEALGAAYLATAGGLKAIAAVSGIGKTAAAVSALFTALRSGKGLSGVGGVLKGGGGVAGCCCGPGGGGAPAGPGGAAKTAEGDAKESGRLAKLAPITSVLKGVAGPAALIYLTATGSQDKPATDAYVKGKVGQQPVGQQTVEALVHAITLAIATKNPNANLKLSPSGVSYDTHGAPKLANATQAVAFIEQYGSAAQVAALEKLAKTYPAVKQGLDAYAQSQSGLNKLLVRGPGLLGGVKGAADEYRGALEKLGTPQDEINKKVSAYSRALHSVPATTRTKVIIDDAQAKIDLANLLTIRNDLSKVVMTVVTNVKSAFGYGKKKAGGGMIAGPGTATSDSIPAWLSNGEYVVRASAVRHWGVDTLHEINSYGAGGPVLPPWLQSGQNPSANAPTSTSSSSSSSSRNQAAGSSAHKAPSKATIANVIAGIVDFAGLSFVDDLKSTEHAIRSGIGQMINRLNNAVRDKYLKTDKTLVHQLRTSRTTLVALAAQEQIVAKSLASARSTLSNLRGQAASVRSGTLASYQGLGDISQLTNVHSVRGIISVERQQDRVGAAFTRNLGILRKKGLSKEQYDELEQAGPGAAGNIVALLATASRGQIAQVNRSTNLLHGLGISTGKASASYLYGARIGAAQAHVTADRALQHDLVHDTRRTANALASYAAADLKHAGNVEKLLADLIKAVHQSAADTGHATAAVLNGTAKGAASHHRSRPSRSNA